MVCYICEALLNEETSDFHYQWHEQLDRTLKALLREDTP